MKKSELGKMIVMLEEIKESLLEKYNKKGFITFNEIKSCFDHELNDTDMDKLVIQLADLNIDVFNEKELSEEVDYSVKFDNIERELYLDRTFNTNETSGSNDIVKSYLKEIGRISLLNDKEELLLGRRIAEGLVARNQLFDMKSTNQDNKSKIDDLKEIIYQGELSKCRIVEANLRLVVSIARTFNGKKLDIMDLIQEGNMGLLKAAERYDYTLGYKFSTYATWWIKQSIGRAIADTDRLIRLPIHIQESLANYYKHRKRLTSIYLREPTISEVASSMGIPIEKAKLLSEVSNRPLSLDINISNDEQSNLSEFIVDLNQNNNPEIITIERHKEQQIHEILETLKPREKYIIVKRFGLENTKPCTLEEIGQELGLTRERIRQIEEKSISKLRHPVRAKYLRDFFRGNQ